MALTAQVSAGGSPQSFKAQLSDVDSTAQDPLGQLRYDLNAVYKYVKFSGTGAVAVGDYVCYVITDTNLQTVDAANSIYGAGVACAIVPAGAVAYGWIQIKGLCTLSTALVSGSAGNVLTATGSNAKTLKVAAADTDQQSAVCIVAATPLVDLIGMN